MLVYVKKYVYIYIYIYIYYIYTFLKAAKQDQIYSTVKPTADR